MFGWNRSFSGGLKFGRLDGEVSHALASAPIPEKVTIPLKQGFGQEVLPLVKEGDRVTAGQIIGAGEHSGSPVHASINGKVVQIAPIFNTKGEKVPGITIEGNESSDWQILSRFSPNYAHKKPEEIRNILYRSGVAALGKQGIPTQFNSSALSLEEVQSVVVTAVNATPYSHSNEYLIRPKLHQFITGLKILHFALNNLPVYLVINKQDEEIVHYLKTESKRETWLRVIAVQPKYPIEHEVLLSRVLFKSFSKLKASQALEAAVQLSAPDILHVYEAVIEGQPLIDRFVALGGKGFVKNLPLRVRIGTSLQDLVASQIKLEMPIRVTLGNILNHFPIPDEPVAVDKDLSFIVAVPEAFQNGNGSNVKKNFIQKALHSLDHYLNGFQHQMVLASEPDSRPCIRCGICEKVCPVHLLPYHLMLACQKNEPEQYRPLGLDTCIQCGLCTYVCPSKIPLYQDILSIQQTNGKQGVTWSL